MAESTDFFSRLSGGREAPPFGSDDSVVEATLQRFSPAIRRKVRGVIAATPRAADLAGVFPGLLAALAERRGGVGRRRIALALIANGARLRTVARALDVPMWMRSLPPEAFRSELPTHLPHSDTLSRRITALNSPPSIEHSAAWLESVLFAERAAGEEFAAWIAKQPRIFQERADADQMLAVLAAYAWCSNARGTKANKLIAVAWRPEIAFDTALCAAKSWLNRVRLVLQLPPGAISDSWLVPGSARGCNFEPLLDSVSILAEAQAMQNCADQYAERIARQRCRLFSVRRDGLRLATLEIAHHPRETNFLSIMQLKGRHNMAAASEVWQAAYAWMADQPDLRSLSPLLQVNAVMSFDNAAWRELMAPYREATDGAPWIKAEADDLMFARFNADMADLARRAGVTSWLFT